jgi:hypothetical protein
MLMIDVYYRFGQHGDFETASALGVVSYLLAMGAALVYVRRSPARRTLGGSPRGWSRSSRGLRHRGAAPEPPPLVARRALDLSRGVAAALGFRYWSRMLTGDFLDPLKMSLSSR